MNIVLLGTNYKITAIKDMEPAYINKQSVSDFLKQNVWEYIQEIVILCTCNRFECYIVTEEPAKAKEELFQAIAVYNQVDVSDVYRLLSSLETTDPLFHLFNVSAGIESMVFGENEILTQVKDAYHRSYECQVSGPILNKVFQAAVACGKRVRSETQISQGAYSVSSIAIEAIREQVLDYFGCRILLIGAGTMGIRALKKLHALGHPDITLTNRTEEKARLFEDDYGIDVLSYEECLSSLDQFDIILAATGAKKPIVTSHQFQDKIPRLIVDLGVPRNVDVDGAGIHVITVGDLKKIADKNIQKRKESVDHVMSIIQTDIEKLEQWYDYKLKCQNV